MKRANLELLLALLGPPVSIAGMAGTMLSAGDARVVAAATTATVSVTLTAVGAYALWSRIGNITARHYVEQAASRAELKHIRDFAARAISPDVSSLDLMDRLQRNDRRTYVAIYQVHPPRPPALCGYFSLMYLSRSGYAKLVDHGQTLLDFSEEDAVNKAGDARALYIAGIAALRGHPRAHCLSRLVSAISQRLSRIRDPDFPILTRPVTPDGVRLTQRYHFRGIDTQTPRNKGLCRQTKGGISPWLADRMI